METVDNLLAVLAALGVAFIVLVLIWTWGRAYFGHDYDAQMALTACAMRLRYVLMVIAFQAVACSILHAVGLSKTALISFIAMLPYVTMVIVGIHYRRRFE